MNQIENKVTIGAPHSKARYENAHRICADCLELSKRVFGRTQEPCGDWIPRPDPIYKAMQIGNDIAGLISVCYVCEKPGFVAVVEFIPEHDKDRDGAMGMCAELGID